ncbi:hypothetical protein ACTWQF_05975 [Streptomyces sp. 8N114]|uniref:hypothetical protein n=1 Tax=Streptomyces sp. 8N114 TaxID=3457419 RepID=UPI003FD2FA36
MTDTPAPLPQVAPGVRAAMAAHIEAALACLDSIPDPVDREVTARALADDLLPEAARRVKSVRGEAVVELRENMKLREVAQLLGLSVPRVDQLAKGK